MGKINEEIIKRLEKDLTEIRFSGITSKEELLNNKPLYETFCQDLFHLASCFSKLYYELLKEIGINYQDAAMDYMVRIIKHLNTLINLHHKALYYYISTIAKNYYSDMRDKYSKRYEKLKTVSLSDPIPGKQYTNGSKEITYGDIIADKKVSPELDYLAKETIIKINKEYSKNADWLLVKLAAITLAARTKDTNRELNQELAKLLLEYGSVLKVIDMLRRDLSETYSIRKDELSEAVTVKSSGLTKVLSKKDVTVKDISKKLSNIRYRIK